MPWLDAPEVERRTEVRPSAVAELLWLQFLITKHRLLPPEPALAPLRPAQDQLRTELAAISPDAGSPHMTALVVLADWTGTLLGDDPEPFLRGLEAAAVGATGPLELRSETPECRQQAIDQLQRMREDRSLVRRERRLLTRIWELVGPEWEARGRAAVTATCRSWTERLRHSTLPELLGRDHLLCRESEDSEPLQGLLGLRSRTVLSPLYFCSRGGFVVDLTAYLYSGAPATPGDDLERADAERVANRLKVLSDGTRLAILRWLATRPSSVMDLAHRFQLAQPTVSNHVRILREAGLLEAERRGTRTLYRAAPDRVEGLLREAGRLVAAGSR